MGQLSKHIPDSTQQYIGSVFKREHIRSMTVYFGIGEERPFYVEKTPSLLIERLRHNLSFFYLNYLLLTGVLFFLTLLISPSAIIGMGLLALAWMWVIRASQSGSLAISGKCLVYLTSTVLVVLLDAKNQKLSHTTTRWTSTGVQIPQKTATIGLSILSIFVLLWLLKGIFWWTVTSSGFLILVHAFLRDASMHKDLEDAVAMEGDLNFGGEDASFLNNNAQVNSV